MQRNEHELPRTTWSDDEILRWASKQQRVSGVHSPLYTVHLDAIAEVHEQRAICDMRNRTVTRETYRPLLPVPRPPA